MNLPDAKLRILVFEDDMIVLQPLAQQLRRDGHEVHCATSNTEAVSIAQKHDLDIAILDLNPTYTSGFDVTAQLDEATSDHLPKVIITASKNRSFREDAVAAGVEVFVEKPFTHSFLRMKMQAALSVTT